MTSSSILLLENVGMTGEVTISLNPLGPLQICILPLNTERQILKAEATLRRHFLVIPSPEQSFGHFLHVR